MTGGATDTTWFAANAFGIAPNNGRPAKSQSSLEKYGAFLGCYYNSVVETITDEEDGQGPTAYGFINAGAIASVKYKVFNLVGLTFVATAAIMDTSATIKANIECTERCITNGSRYDTEGYATV